MKNRRALLFATVFGLSAALLLVLYVSSKETYWKDKYGEEIILIAKTDIPRYQLIDETMLAKKKIPKAFKEPDALDETDLGIVLGYRADTTIKQGGQITLTKISKPGESRISLEIDENSRACTIPVNEISGVAGLIRPGDHIDILATFKTLDEKTNLANSVQTMTLFQNHQVLSVGKNYMFDGAMPEKRSKALTASPQIMSFSNITIAATPRECMDLAVAQQVGTLSLSLRSYLNRFGGEEDPSLKEEHSTTQSVTGIKQKIEISRRPRWMELRGNQTMMVP